MKKAHHVRCILFDLGSTLWTRIDKDAFESIEHASNIDVAKVLRHFTKDKKFSSMKSHTLGALLRNAVEKQIRSEAHRNPEYEPDFVLATMDALRQLGISKVNQSLGEDIYEALRIRIPESRLLFDDALTTLEELRQRGYILGVVTNRHYGGRLFHEDLHSMGLLDYFEYEHMAISADLGIRKPHPDIFMYALNRLGVSPEEAAMVGDSLRADVQGAKMLNMLAIWKPKASLREEAKVAWKSSSVASPEPGTHKGVGQSRGTSAETASLGAFENEDKVTLLDDYLLTYLHTRDGQKHHVRQDDLKPDIIIENLKDLLEIF